MKAEAAEVNAMTVPVTRMLIEFRISGKKVLAFSRINVLCSWKPQEIYRYGSHLYIVLAKHN